jgi:hypothetical protein
MTEKKQLKTKLPAKKKVVKKRNNLSVTNAEKDRRVMECVQLLSQGFSRPEIIHYFSEKYNKLTDRCTDNYIHAARNKIKENFDLMFDKQYFKANIFKRLEDLYRNSYDIDDFKECRVILKDLRDMLGINEASKVDLTTDGEKLPTSNAITIEIVKPKEQDE